jgi:hypothetical protein
MNKKFKPENSASIMKIFNNGKESMDIIVVELYKNRRK